MKRLLEFILSRLFPAETCKNSITMRMKALIPPDPSRGDLLHWIEGRHKRQCA
jgi:hypothetical protein